MEKYFKIARTGKKEPKMTQKDFLQMVDAWSQVLPDPENEGKKDGINNDLLAKVSPYLNRNL